jgi:small-conductance mechanosensitive channel
MDIQTKQETLPEKDPATDPSVHHWLIGLYLGLAVAFVIVYFLSRTGHLPLPSHSLRLLMNICEAGFASSIVMAVSRFAEKSMSKNAKLKTSRYNVIRFIRLLSFVIIVFIFVSFMNQNWYATAVSLGLISLLLGFALQTPIASLIGWFYIIARTPYRIGDRIQVGNFTGDVVEIHYLDTTLWEFAGNYMTNDMPSGRLIRFPNSLLFTTEVYNYSWKKFPYIWNEIPFHVAYESDLSFIEQTVRRVTKEELGTEMESEVRKLRAMIDDTPVNEEQIKEYPFVQFRTNVNTWIEVLVIYLVEPRQSGAVRSRIIKRILHELLKEPDKAQFPKSNAR